VPKPDPSSDPGKARPFAARAVTCGVLVTDSARLLLGHATRSPRWDIPKGVALPGEEFAEAALRELREETGLAPVRSALVALGLHPYLRGKDICLFAWMPKRLPDPAALRCTSTFTTREGHILPELDRFALVPWDEAMTRIGASLARLLGSLPSMASLRRKGTEDGRS
jgi:8-oxo-dGTP pyrophosphatase MutT (NUDIX family)